MRTWILALTLSLGPLVFGDETLPGSAAGDIMKLRDEAAELESALGSLDLQLEDARLTLKDRVARDQAEAALRALSITDPRAERYRDELAYYDSTRSWSKDNTREALYTRIRQLEQKKNETQKKMRDNERQMYRVTLVELDRQKFINQISWIFGGLAALLILGYFSVIFRAPKVMRTVFQGVGGLQMITLFSVVIAIILFGITGILEAKELSALLGSLIGYILGRVSDKDVAKPDEKTKPELQEKLDGAIPH